MLYSWEPMGAFQSEPGHTLTMVGSFWRHLLGSPVEPPPSAVHYVSTEYWRCLQIQNRRNQENEEDDD